MSNDEVPRARRRIPVRSTRPIRTTVTQPLRQTSRLATTSRLRRLRSRTRAPLTSSGPRRSSGRRRTMRRRSSILTPRPRLLIRRRSTHRRATHRRAIRRRVIHSRDYQAGYGQAYGQPETPQDPQWPAPGSDGYLPPSRCDAAAGTGCPEVQRRRGQTDRDCCPHRLAGRSRWRCAGLSAGQRFHLSSSVSVNAPSDPAALSPRADGSIASIAEAVLPGVVSGSIRRRPGRIWIRLHRQRGRLHPDEQPRDRGCGGQRHGSMWCCATVLAWRVNSSDAMRTTTSLS